MGLAQQSADLLPDLGLGHSHHHHEGRDIIQHVGQQLILIVFQTLPLQISQGNIPAKSRQTTVQAIHVFHNFTALIMIKVSRQNFTCQSFLQAPDPFQ